MGRFFNSGHVVDAILAVFACEAFVYAVIRRWSPGAMMRFAVAALPGIFLLLALREALTGAGWSWIALWLALSFPAHLADLRLRSH
jgi:uncharacterized membrane protein YjjP (DUF1212 family)